MEKIKIAYLLMCHKNAEQLNLFINQLLNYGEGDIYIHIDKKNIEIKDKILKNERVFLYSEYDVKWGSFEIVLAGIFLMKKAIESKRKYSHFYFGSGQDLVIKKGLYEYLKKSNKDVYMHISKKIKSSDLEAARYLIKWSPKLMIRNDLHVYRFIRIILQILLKIGVNFFPNKLTLKRKVIFYEGRTWFIAKEEVINFILKYIYENPDYIKYWKKSLASDLMFFQTIIMNSLYSKNISEELMFVKFGNTFKTRNHPLTITMKNRNEIELGDYFFARKFEMKEDDNVIKYYIAKTKNN